LAYFGSLIGHISALENSWAILKSVISSGGLFFIYIFPFLKICLGRFFKFKFY